jgi:hypothetical protein
LLTVLYAHGLSKYIKGRVRNGIKKPVSILS